MTATEKKQQYISEFAKMPDSYDRLSYLIALSTKVDKPSNEILTDKNLEKDCQSKVWISGTGRNLIVYSDTLLIRGLLYIAWDIRVNSEDWSEEKELSVEFFKECGIGSVITGSRKSGFTAVLKRISE